MLSPGLIFVIGAVALGGLAWLLRWPLPLALIVVAIIASLLAGFGIPFRHLVEGGFGYFNLILALFAGAFFGQVLQKAGIADAFAGRIHNLVGGNRFVVLTIAAFLLYVVGMFVGIAGVSVLAMGVLVAPMLRKLGMEPHRIGAFIAVVATCGMIAPPVNVPAMTIADGVNMPYLGFGPALLALSVPPTIFMVISGAMKLRNHATVSSPEEHSGRLAAIGLLSIGGVFLFWTVLRVFPATIPDPAVPIVLVVGGLLALPALGRVRLSQTMGSIFSGTPLVLAAVLVTVGVLVQIMTLTGIRGWLVINSMAFPPPWTFVEMIAMPIIGGVLTSIGSANILGVPFAFALIHQDMILNVSGLSAIAALSEFVPPTAISAALATYIVGDTRVGSVLKASIGGAIVIAVLALVMLIFTQDLSSILVFENVSIREH